MSTAETSKNKRNHQFNIVLIIERWSHQFQKLSISKLSNSNQSTRMEYIKTDIFHFSFSYTSLRRIKWKKIKRRKSIDQKLRSIS